jgi:hypothetical protein
MKIKNKIKKIQAVPGTAVAHKNNTTSRFYLEEK